MLNSSRDIKRADLVWQLDQELTQMARTQYETPEFKLLFSTPLTIERARINAILTIYYGVNRRDCWAYVQARSPYAVKKSFGNMKRTSSASTPAAEPITKPYSAAKPLI